MEFVIKMTWDNEANVCVATSDDIPGLVFESGSFDAILERVRIAVPELPEVNSCGKDSCWLSFEMSRCEMVAL